MKQDQSQDVQNWISRINVDPSQIPQAPLEAAVTSTSISTEESKMVEEGVNDHAQAPNDHIEVEDTNKASDNLETSTFKEDVNNNIVEEVTTAEENNVNATIVHEEEAKQVDNDTMSIENPNNKESADSQDNENNQHSNDLKEGSTAPNSETSNGQTVA